MYDTVSGVEGAGQYQQGAVSTVVRFPYNTKLVVTLDDTFPE